MLQYIHSHSFIIMSIHPFIHQFIHSLMYHVPSHLLSVASIHPHPSTSQTIILYPSIHSPTHASTICASIIPPLLVCLPFPSLFPMFCRSSTMPIFQRKPRSSSSMHSPWVNWQGCTTTPKITRVQTEARQTDQPSGKRCTLSCWPSPPPSSLEFASVTRWAG